MNCSIPGSFVLHCLPEFAQIHVHGVSDAIQPSRPLLLPSPPAFHLSQHQFPLSFPMSQFFASGGQSTGASASASVHPMNMQGWFPLELTSLIFSLPKGLSRVFSNTTVQKHHFFTLSLLYDLTLNCSLSQFPFLTLLWSLDCSQTVHDWT